MINMLIILIGVCFYGLFLSLSYSEACDNDNDLKAFLFFVCAILSLVGTFIILFARF